MKMTKSTEFLESMDNIKKKIDIMVS